VGGASASYGWPLRAVSGLRPPDRPGNGGFRGSASKIRISTYAIALAEMGTMESKSVVGSEVPCSRMGTGCFHAEPLFMLGS
jgi:hypothetical protein